jgi:hypothetical protein
MGRVGTSLNADDDNGAGRQAETARYIEEMTAELSTMARRSQLPVLSYLLDLARIEAGVSGHRLPVEDERSEIRRRG